MSDPNDREQRLWAELGEQWRKDAAGAARLAAVDPDVVRARAGKLARTIRRRNARELVAGAVVIAFGVYRMSTATAWLAQLSGAAMIAGAAFVSAVLLRRGGNLPPPPPTAVTSEVMAFERAELERQAALLERVWLWYIAPLLPGIALSLADSYVEAVRAGRPLWLFAPIVALCAAVLVGVGWLNARAARRLRVRARVVVDEDATREASSTR
jgi:hypothetical protein